MLTQIFSKVTKLDSKLINSTILVLYQCPFVEHNIAKNLLIMWCTPMFNHDNWNLPIEVENVAPDISLILLSLCNLKKFQSYKNWLGIMNILTLK